MYDRAVSARGFKCTPVLFSSPWKCSDVWNAETNAPKGNALDPIFFDVSSGSLNNIGSKYARWIVETKTTGLLHIVRYVKNIRIVGTNALAS